MFLINKSKKRLINAIEVKDLTKIREIIQNGIDLNYRFKNLTPIQAITKFDFEEYEEILDLFLLNGAKLDFTDSVGKTCLWDVCLNSDIEKAKLLVSRGANTNHLSIIKETIIMEVISSVGIEQAGSLYEIIQLLVNNGGDPGLKNKKGENVYFYFDRKDGSVNSIMEILLSKGADINIKNNEGETPLISIISKIDSESEHEYLKIIKDFINSGADVNICDNQGLSPLYYAVIQGLIITSGFLLKSGADVNKEANVGVRIIEDVLKTDYDENIVLELVKLLIKSGADLNIYSPFKNYPLIYIAESASTHKIFKYLIEQGADINLLDHRGGNLLMQACFADHYQNAEFLINKGINIDYQIKSGEFKGMTALMTAAASGSIECTKLLLKYGANTKLQESVFNATAQKIARKQNQFEIEKLIRDNN